MIHNNKWRHVINGCNALLVVLTCLKMSPTIAADQQFSPNIRYHETHPNVTFNYSYMNLKKWQGYKLELTPLDSFTATNKSSCVKACLKTKGILQSFLNKINSFF